MAKKKTGKKKAKRAKKKNSKVIKITDSKKIINTATKAVSEYADGLKERADDGKVRGVLVVEFGNDPSDSGIKQAGAMGLHEVAFAALLIQQLAIGQIK